MKSIKELLSYHDLFIGIVAALETRDPYTANHSMRVAEMVEQLCFLLHLPAPQSAAIHIAAHVHDLGKIGIEDAVLRKSGPLNDAEWQQMKAHPVIGAEILGKVEYFSEIAQMVRHHHERWDGKGYPNQLAREEIPLGSRIIAVADATDAMLSHRCYRTGLQQNVCRNEIVRNAGIMFDPKIAATAADNWELLMEARKHHGDEANEMQRCLISG